MNNINIKRADAVADMSLRESSSGQRHIFSIKFVTKKGEFIYLPYATAAGLRSPNIDNRLRGVQPCTSQGLPTGNVIAVSIDNIIEYNKKTVTL